MKYIKMLGLAAVAAAALMAFIGAGTASATQLTDGEGNVLGVGTKIHASAEEPVILHPPIGEIKCSVSTVAGEVDNAGGATSTVLGGIDVLTFEGCNATVHVLDKGSLEIHTTFESTGNPATSHQKTNSDGNGTLTSKGTRVTVVFSGFHCIFETNPTNGTDIGTLTGSSNTEDGTATLDIEATIPRVSGNSGFFCGEKAQWTGAYSVEAPDPLNVH